MMMFSIFATLLLWKINPRTWLSWYFEACAANAGQAPVDFKNFLPWSVGDGRQKELRSPALPVPADSSWPTDPDQKYFAINFAAESEKPTQLRTTCVNFRTHLRRKFKAENR